MLLKDGTIIINNAYSIVPRMYIDDFLSLEISKAAKKTGEYGEMQVYNLIGCNVANKRMSLLLYFKNKNLESVTMGLYEQHHETGTSESINDLKKILKKNLGTPPYEYEWGTIRAVHDSIGWADRIQINYK